MRLGIGENMRKSANFGAALQRFRDAQGPETIGFRASNPQQQTMMRDGQAAFFASKIVFLFSSDRPPRKLQAARQAGFYSRMD